MHKSVRRAPSHAEIRFADELARAPRRGGLADGTPLPLAGFGLRKSDGRGDAMGGFAKSLGNIGVPEPATGPRPAAEPMGAPSGRHFAHAQNALLSRLTSGARMRPEGE